MFLIYESLSFENSIDLVPSGDVPFAYLEGGLQFNPSGSKNRHVLTRFAAPALCMCRHISGAGLRLKHSGDCTHD